jgi:hypothetical protein
MEDERQDSSAEAALNGHASAAPAGHQADIDGTDSVEPVVAGHAPPTPAKDVMASGRTTALEPTPEGTSVAGC